MDKKIAFESVFILPELEIPEIKEVVGSDDMIPFKLHSGYLSDVALLYNIGTRNILEDDLNDLEF